MITFCNIATLSYPKISNQTIPPVLLLFFLSWVAYEIKPKFLWSLKLGLTLQSGSLCLPLLSLCFKQVGIFITPYLMLCQWWVQQVIAFHHFYLCDSQPTCDTFHVPPGTSDTCRPTTTPCMKECSLFSSCSISHRLHNDLDFIVGSYLK